MDYKEFLNKYGYEIAEQEGDDRVFTKVKYKKDRKNYADLDES